MSLGDWMAATADALVRVADGQQDVCAPALPREPLHYDERPEHPNCAALRRALEARRRTTARDAILGRLAAGLYGATTSPYAAPGDTLAQHLSAAGFGDLTRRLIDGEFYF